MANSSIIICDQPFDVGVPVVTWKDDPSISAYTPHCVGDPSKLYALTPAKGIGQNTMRYRGRRLIGADRSLPRLKQVLRQFVVHHDGMGSSRDCFRVLHDERGLSVHFLLDNDGTIFQTLDLVECGFQAAGVNEISVGVELCSRGDKLELTPHQQELYEKYKRDQVTCVVNGHQWLCWDYTKEQYDSMIALGRALARIFPGLPQAFPTDGSGEPLRDTLGSDPRSYAGYLGHYHVTNQKWDPGPWDFKRFVQAIRGRVFYPAVPRRESAELPEDPAQLKEVTQALYDNNEKEGEGGYYPVGPLGYSRLWHGGLHLRGEPGAPVVSPFAGKIVLARLTPEDDWPKYGSNSFVLLRHEMSVAGAALTFFTLFMHIGEELDGDKQAGWVKAARERTFAKELRAGEVVRPDVAVSAGEVVAHFGLAGPKGAGQVHFEIFSAEELGAKVGDGWWTALDGSKGGRFCTLPQVNGLIDYNRNGYLEKQEFLYFFRARPEREQLHKLAVRHVSEWGDNGDFENAIVRAPDLTTMPQGRRHDLYVNTIESYLWWGDDLASLGLPDDKVIWGYHPIGFVAWINDKLKGPASDASIQDKNAYKNKKPPAEIKDDTEDDAGGFTDDEDALFGEAARQLDLEKLAGGYPDK